MKSRYLRGRISLRCDVAQGMLGYPLVCQWFARLPASEHPQAAAVLSRTGALRLCASTTGTTNLLFMMWLRSAAEITEIEARLEEALPRLQLAESVVLTHIPKRFGWALDPQGRAKHLLTEPADHWCGTLMRVVGEALVRLRVWRHSMLRNRILRAPSPRNGCVPRSSPRSGSRLRQVRATTTPPPMCSAAWASSSWTR